jgi:hypothetical protein
MKVSPEIIFRKKIATAPHDNHANQLIEDYHHCGKAQENKNKNKTKGPLISPRT